MKQVRVAMAKAFPNADMTEFKVAWFGCQRACKGLNNCHRRLSRRRQQRWLLTKPAMMTNRGKVLVNLIEQGCVLLV
jgi:hypothetical protein